MSGSTIDQTTSYHQAQQAEQPAPFGAGAPAPTLLTRDAILAADDDQVELVQVPEWSGSLYVRGMNAAQLENLYRSMNRGKGTKVRVETTNFQARVVARCAMEGPQRDARRLFDASDVEALSKKSGAALKRVYDVAARLSGITQAEEEETAEDFDDARSDDSSTD